MEYVSLHNHSEYSFLDGLATPENMVARAVELGHEAFAITDHGNVSAHLKFKHACEEAGIKFIPGEEMYFTDDRNIKEGKKGQNYDHMCAWALNDEGLRNLWTLSSLGFIEGLWYNDPRVDFELLERYSDGIAISSGCMGGCINKYLHSGQGNLSFERATERIGRFLNIFGDRFYMELHAYNADEQRETNRNVIQLAQEYSLPLIAVSDAHYLKPEDWQVHELITAVGMKKTLTDANRIQHGPDQLSLYTGDEMAKRLDYLPANIVKEAIDNTVTFAAGVNVSIQEKLVLPVFKNTEHEDEVELKDLAVKGLLKRHVDRTKSEEYINRLKYEIDMILDKKFAGYFLIVADLVRWSKDNGLLLGAARGSSGGSLLAYCLGITEIDPLKYELYFERFLDPERVSLPDIDLDFPKEERHLAKEYLENKYGKDSIATICTFTTVHQRSALRDLCNGMNLPPEDRNRMLALLDEVPFGPGDTDIPRHGKFKFAKWEKKYPELFEYFPRYMLHIRQDSRHAAGVVISKESLMGRLPLSVQQEQVTTQFDMKDVESMGFVKEDLLGIRNLSTLMRAVALIQEPMKHFYEWGDAEYNDPAVWDSICTGNNIGCFQIETAGQRGLAPRFKPRSIEDLGAMIAAYRPGLLDAKDEHTGLSMFEMYMRRKEGNDSITYLHPLLEPVLKETEGCFLYQEEVMKACQVLAGYTLADAQRMRKAIGKKLPEEMRAERSIFVKGCYDANKIDDHLANQIFDELQSHERYSFNKSHSIAYAFLAYWCAYVKWYYPIEYMLALFQTDPKKTATYFRECQRLGIKILPPDINLSGIDFKIEGGNIRFGLGHVMWGPTSKKIEEGQPYLDMADLVKRTDSRILGKRQIESLGKVGALGSLATGPDNALWLYWDARKSWKKFDTLHPSSCPLCAGLKSEFDCWCDEVEIDNLVKHEVELLGMTISSDPLGPHMGMIEEWTNYDPNFPYEKGDKVKLGGMIAKIQTMTVKNGKSAGREMARIHVQLPEFMDREEITEAVLEDVGEDADEGTVHSIELVVFPDGLAAIKDKLQIGKAILVIASKLDDSFMLSSMRGLDEIDAY